MVTHSHLLNEILEGFLMATPQPSYLNIYPHKALQLLHPPKIHGTISVCKDPILFDLFSYCDVRIQSNPFILKGDKRVLVERAW